MLTNLSDKIYRHLALLLLGSIAIVAVFTFQEYGITWDEELQNNYGQAVFDYYASGLSDRHYNQIFNLHLYGGMFDGVAAIVNEITPYSIYETRHLLNAMIGMLGLWGTWRLGRLIGGGFVGVAAMLLLAITPMFYGHMFNNPKDIPFATGVVWTLYYMTKTLSAYPSIRTSMLVKLGVVFGLTLGVRVNGIMLAGHWGLVMLLLALVPFAKIDRYRVKLAAKTLGRAFAIVGIISYAVMLFCWPWAQEAPIQNPLRAIMEFSNFPQIVEVIFNGKIMLSNELPWFYVPMYFMVQLPVLHLILMSLGLFYIIETTSRMSTKGKKASIALLLLTIFFPVAYAMLTNPALYDAVRHFIFILPPLCIIAALVLKSITRAVYEENEPSTSVWTKSLFAFIAVVLICEPVYTMIRLHPYEYVYLNQFEGGVRGGYGQYEMDYWGSSFKEASERLEAYIEDKELDYEKKTYKVAICGPWSAATNFFPKNFVPVQANLEADFFLSTTRWMCQNMREGQEIFRIERYGAPLSIVKDVRHYPLPK